MLRETREAVWTRSGGRCEVVRGGRRCSLLVDRSNWEGHVHHLVYRGHGAERPEDLVLACLACHGLAHPGREFLDRGEQARRCAERRARRLQPDARGQDEYAGLAASERRALERGAGRWAWRPGE